MSSRPNPSQAETNFFLAIESLFGGWLTSPPPHPRTSEADKLWTLYHRLKESYRSTKTLILRDNCWLTDEMTKCWAQIDWHMTLLDTVDPTLPQPEPAVATR